MFKNPGGDDCILAEVELFHQMKYTLRKTNLAPENRPSQKESSFPTTNFQVRAVSFREIILRVYHLSPNPLNCHQLDVLEKHLLASEPRKKPS